MSLLVDLCLEILENAMVDHLVSAEVESCRGRVDVVVWLVVLRIDVKKICQGERGCQRGCLLCIHLLIVQVRRTTKEIVDRAQYSLILHYCLIVSVWDHWVHRHMEELCSLNTDMKASELYGYRTDIVDTGLSLIY